MKKPLWLAAVVVVALVALTSPLQSQFASKEEWSAANGTLPGWFSSSASTERGAGVGVVGGELTGFIVSRNSGNHIYIFRGDTIGQLNLTGVSGGTFAINDAEVSDDGLIFAANLTTNAATSPFKVYRWDSLTATPTVAINFTGIAGHRLGDKFTVVGKASDNTLTIWAAVASQDTVYRWTTSDNGATFTNTAILLSDGNGGGSPSVGPVGTGASAFYYNSNGQSAKYYDAAGTLSGTIPQSAVATGSNAIRFLQFGGKDYVFVFHYGSGNENGRLVDVTAGAASATTVGITSSLGSNANSNGTGDVEIMSTSAEYFEVFVLSTNNGLGGYSYPSYDVTFQVNMSIKMREGSFQPASDDSVWVRGSFNGWGATALLDGDADSIYTGIIPVVSDTIYYKFYKTLRGGSDWEGDPNRSAIIGMGDTTLPLTGTKDDFFDRDSVYDAPAVQVPVTFQVNMSVKMKEGAFLPGSGDFVWVQGNFNGWSQVDTLADANNDSIYTKTLNLDEAFLVKYKYRKTLRGGSDWESGPDFEYTVPTGGGSVPLRYFDNDNVVNVPVTANILWQVDLAAYEELGWFSRAAGDSVEVRGGFNGWAGDKLARVPGTEIYELQLPYSGFSFDLIAHKFYMDIVDSLTGVARFGSAYSDDPDGVRYDHPAERGDGNRQFNVQNGGTLEAPLFYFSSINPGGIIKSGDSVEVTFMVDMTAALSEAQAFVPASDTVWMVWTDAASRGAQGAPETMVMSNTTGNMYTGTITLHGPAHYNFQYVYRYGASGTTQEEGAGLGAQNGHRSRFVTPTGYQTFPTTFNLTQDSWQKNPPMPVETPPLVTGVEGESELAVPLTYELQQNYPNPFNPSTTIRYSIPTQTRVILKVYNMIGQEVTTLVDEMKPAGVHIAAFDAKSLATGVYFYSLKAGDFREVKKMVLLK